MIAIAERIMEVAADRLAEIQVANGYPVNATVIRSVRRNTHSPIDAAIYVSMDELTPNEALSYSGNPPVKGWDLVVRCSYIMTPPEDHYEFADTLRIEAYTSMHTAITSAADWYRFADDGGPLAVDATIEAPEFMRNSEQGQMGCHLIVRVKFRTNEDDPTVRRA
jgi:hypothetical protein